MNNMELNDLLWEIDQIILENQKILGDKRTLSEEDEVQLKKNRQKIEKLYRRIEDESSRL